MRKLHPRGTDEPNYDLVPAVEHGLTEIVAYLEITHTSFTITMGESAEDVLEWSGMTEDGSPIHKSARLPRVIFVR